MIGDIPPGLLARTDQHMAMASTTIDELVAAYRRAVAAGRHPYAAQGILVISFATLLDRAELAGMLALAIARLSEPSKPDGNSPLAAGGDR